MAPPRWTWFFLAGLTITVPLAICAYRIPTGISAFLIMYAMQLILVITINFTALAEHQEDALFITFFFPTFGFFISSTSPNPNPFFVAVQVLFSAIAATPVSIVAFLFASRVRFQEDTGNESRFKYFISDHVFSSQTSVDHVFRLPRRVKKAFVKHLLSQFPHSTSDNSYKTINP
ncbi:hypothetical protein GYMLUDRAFT_86814 [Collybiopsis luxurians FD-317 M1]|uniref:Uncharacterized protein n=1 Tax=Collybiopsis luxurians FD-317 M1 TaxID=944289 RepID=A0A0D0B2G2_9AGAR|nr:hypothetical protein GYMLUDRAFT_86814 [Collybiopsis luxurians FD-317 M1]